MTRRHGKSPVTPSASRGRPILKFAVIGLGSIVVVALVLGGQILVILNRKPTVSIDYVQRLADRTQGIPEPERGYPIYLQALAAERGLDEGQLTRLRIYKPGDPASSQFTADTVAKHQALLELVRRAAGKPYAAVPIGVSEDPAFLVATGALPDTGEEPVNTTTPQGSTAPDAPPPLFIDVRLPMLRVYRTFANDLRADAAIAIAAGDMARATDDIIAMTGLARHSGEEGTLFSQMLRAAVASNAADTLQRAVHTNPHAFSDADLARIAEALRDLRDNHTAISFEIERWVYADVMQRLFTDDGTGDGVIAPTAAQAMFRKLGILDPSMPTGLAAAALAPIASTRAEVQATFDAIMDNVQQTADTPLWQLEDRKPDPKNTASVEDIKSWDETYLPDLSKLYFSAFIPALSKSLTIGQFTAQRLDAALLTIAVHRHHLRTGQWPAALESIPADLLPEPPIDRHTGKPLIYRVTATGPLIYGVGPDNDDDQGIPAATPAIWFPAATRAQRVASDVTKYEGDWVFYPPPDDE